MVACVRPSLLFVPNDTPVWTDHALSAHHWRTFKLFVLFGYHAAMNTGVQVFVTACVFIVLGCSAGSRNAGSHGN